MKKITEFPILATASMADQIPVVDDLDIVTKRSTFQVVYDLFKTNFDGLYASVTYANSTPDFYQYSISRTVSGGSLIVALKNYLGNDPTPSVPVKIQIGGVVRTITSALSNTQNAGFSWMNLGSAELATKEIDLFAYLCYVTASSQVVIGWGRFATALTNADTSNVSVQSEKYVGTNVNMATTDSMVCIGRFNAILSGGAGYTWSIPATSVIVNRPIFSTRNTLDFDSTITASGSMTVTSPVKGGAYYKFQGDMFECVVSYAMTLGGTASNELRFTLPFGINQVVNYTIEGFGSYYNTTNDTALICQMDNLTKNSVRVKRYDSSVFTLGASQDIKFMIRGRL